MLLFKRSKPYRPASFCFQIKLWSSYCPRFIRQVLNVTVGAAGAAIATLFSRIVNSAIQLFLLHNKKYEVHVEHLLRYRPDFGIIKKMLHIGIPNGIENSMFQFGRLLTQTLISGLGTTVIAANAVSLTIANIQYMTGTACSAAMVPVVGRCIGAGERRQAKHYSRRILGLPRGWRRKVSYVRFDALNVDHPRGRCLRYGT